MEKADNLVALASTEGGTPKLNLREILVGRITRLRYIKRFSICPRVHEESVAEHSYYTAFIALVVALDLQASGLEVQLGKLLARALMHDVDESYSGDFIRMFKHFTPGLKAAIDAAATHFMQRFSRENGLGTLYLGLWSQAKDDSLEGAILSFADFASVVSYVAQEIRSGNVVMREQLPELNKFAASFGDGKYTPLKKYLKEAQEVIDGLEANS